MKLLEANDRRTTEVAESKPTTMPRTSQSDSTNGHPPNTTSLGNDPTNPHNNNNIKGLKLKNHDILKSLTTSNNCATNMLDSCTSPSPDGSEGEFLEYTESSHYSSVLTGINNLRRQGQFCDIKLVVEDHEFPVHRAVLAVCSPYMFDFMSCLEETTEQQPTYKVKDVPSTGFQYLLDFMYTGSLCVPLHEVPIVYATALLLKMESASRVCASFLSNHLTTANCLGVRQFSKDSAFQASVDDFIRANLKDIMNSKSFFGLTDLQVEVVGLDENISDEKMERRLFSLVLDWAKKNLNDLKPKLDRLTEKVNVLYLESDNTLRDCADVEDIVLSSDDDVVQDYKILARRRSKINSKGTSPRTKAGHHGNGSVQGFHKFSLNPEESVSMAEREWNIVATQKTSENAYLAIAILDGHLMAISVHIRPMGCSGGVDTPTDCSVPNLPSPATSVNGGTGQGQFSPIIRKATLELLETMGAARCALGAVALNDQIIVCGGYDRGECLASMESFTMAENKWLPRSPMNIARGRLSAAVLGNCIYACGGSDGWKELSCVEKYDPISDKWTFMASMIKERSSHGVVTLDDKLYCIGGCEGQRSIAQCEVYDPATNKWSPIAPLNTARSQMCVCAMNGLLFAIGGTDLWNTLNTVEVYNPEVNEWTLHSQLNIARRGAGVNIVNGMMVVLGGSDGTQSLVSTEVYDPIADLWTVGPPLNTPRANLSAVTLNNRLFAVGGFSGKKFLPTLEWLDPDDMEWFGHAPKLTSSSTESSPGAHSASESVENGNSSQSAQKDTAAGVPEPSQKDLEVVREGKKSQNSFCSGRVEKSEKEEKVNSEGSRQSSSNGCDKGSGPKS